MLRRIEQSGRSLLVPIAGVLLLSLMLAGATAIASAQAPDLPLPTAASPNAVPPELAALRINEFMARNQTTLEDPDDPGQFPDWIEIYNPGPNPVDLRNKVAITDDASGNPAKHVFTRTLTVPAQGFLVLYADNEPEQGAAHLSFALSASGEEIGLFYVGGGGAESIDVYAYSAWDPVREESEGRRPDGGSTWVKFGVPTPGASNMLNPPTIVSVTRAVEIPQAGQSVTVTALITDDGSVSATLVYTVTGSGAGTASMSPIGGNQYRAVINGHPADTYVAYHVRAVDNEANERRSPNYGYLVGYEPPNLVINEVVAENYSKVEDEDDPGEYPDWMEIFNPGTEPVNLAGLSLTDNPREPLKYLITGTITLSPQQFLLVYLDDDPEQSNNVNVHTNFSLDKNGEFIGLYGGQGSVLIDGFEFGQQYDNVALGRYPDGAPGSPITLLCATPRQPNIQCVPAAFLPVGRAP